jgi:hypothetical protein
MIGRQSVPDFEIHHRIGRAVIMIGERSILGHLVDLQRLHVDNRQIAAVDHALLGGGDDLAKRHRHRAAAEPVDGVAEYLCLLHADFHSAQVFRLDDRLLRGPEMAEAIVEIAEHLELVVVLDLLADLVADPPVEHGVGRSIILHQIRHEQRAHFRKYGCGGARRAAHRDASRFDRVHDLELLRDQGFAEELHVKRAF